MNSNNLTALLTALAVVPLYFKEPSQPAPEKWEYACLEYWPGDGPNMGSVVKNSDANMKMVNRDNSGFWNVTWTKNTRPVGALLDKTEIGSDKFAPNLVGKEQAESAVHLFYLSEINRMEKEGWIPFAAHPAGEMGRSTIYYRRQVQ